MYRLIYLAALWALVPAAAFFLILCALFSRFLGMRKAKPRLVWGSEPIINNKYWSQAMKLAGYESSTYTVNYYDSINKRSDWDRVLSDEFSGIPYAFKLIMAFAISLFRYDVFFIGFNGYFIGNTPIWRIQAFIFRLARKQTVLIPFGSDFFVYKRIRSTSLIHGLLLSYPLAARRQDRIAAQLDYWVRYADVVLPGMMGPDGSGRWDVLAPSNLCIDLSLWKSSQRNSKANGKNGTVYIAHAPNHRGFKGSEFVIEAVRRLSEEGLSVELILLEKVQNEVVRQQLRENADILVEQIIATGHGFSAVEGMASGLAVISNLEDTSYTLPLRRWSFLDECPIASASPETLQDVLKKLITRPLLRKELGKAGRVYVEKYHSFKTAQHLFQSILSYMNGQDVNLLDLYHPIKGEYPKSLPKVEHPLRNNRIVD
jgi:hypothetical protein|tara:strand:- start:1629 stop:2915 length:1287 start_codon:yes stop_codon:yes gene_type:complete